MLESKEAEVSDLKKINKHQDLTDAQLKKIRDQEAEIAALKLQLSERQNGASSRQPSSSQPSSSKLPEDRKSVV